MSVDSINIVSSDITGPDDELVGFDYSFDYHHARWREKKSVAKKDTRRVQV